MSWCKLVNKLNYVPINNTNLINPSLPNYIDRQSNKSNYWKKNFKLLLYYSAFTRLNHLKLRNKNIRLYWLKWFKKFADITFRLECDTTQGVTLEYGKDYNNKLILKRSNEGNKFLA